MAPKQATCGEKPKWKVVMVTIEQEKELVAKWKTGARSSDLAVQHSMANASISILGKNKETIKAADVVNGVKVDQ